MPKFIRLRTVLTIAAAGTVALGIPAAASAASSGGANGHSAPANDFSQTNLVSDLSNVGAKVVDPNLQNSWGLAQSATSPLWVADNGTSVATLYSIPAGGATATKVGLTVTVPPTDSNPTGQVNNPTTGFVVTTPSGSGAAPFIFDSEGGQIIAWNPTADPVTAGASTATVEYTSPTGVYKGLAIASFQFNNYLYATNFHDGTVDVFNSSFQPVQLAGNFSDPFLPRGYAPFGIASINGLLYVSYALQDAQKHDDVAGHGHGFVDIFTDNGFLVKRLVSRGDLNSPWGLTVAPAGFGPFGGDLLVGNFGDGLIHAYDPLTGRPAGALRGTDHRPVQIDGLWGLQFGTASTGGTGTLLFSAGPNDEADGLVGALNPVP